MPVQGYLAHKKLRPPRTLQWDYTQGPVVVLGGGRFLMNEAPLHQKSGRPSLSRLRAESERSESNKPLFRFFFKEECK